MNSSKDSKRAWQFNKTAEAHFKEKVLHFENGGLFCWNLLIFFNLEGMAGVKAEQECKTV
ncbi:hypothetical protein BIV59_22285 [Bacillus sp. MUM 13]|nr:hypothetical protein BIV59_22285 [Bacillus sp. MUM 13]